MGNPYAPQDESSSALRFDRLVLLGGFLGYIAYGKLHGSTSRLSSCSYRSAGLHIIIAIACVKALIQDKTLQHRRRNALTIAFVSTLFVLATLNLAFTSEFFVEMLVIDGLSGWLRKGHLRALHRFVNNRLFPGGPSQYIQANISNLPSQVQNITYIMDNLLADGLLVRSIVSYIQRV
jgi:hypothetical protein